MNKQKTKSLATKLSLAMGGVVLLTCFLLVGTCSWVELERMVWRYVKYAAYNDIYVERL